MENSNFIFFIKCQKNKENYIYYLEKILNLLPPIIVASCIIAVFVNFLLCTVLLRAMLLERLISKRLLFVINRSFCDLLTALVAGLYIFGVRINCDLLDCQATSVIPDIFMEIIITLNYWILAASYAGVSVLTCYAIRWPLKYKTSLSSTKILFYIIIFWSFLILLILFIFLLEREALFDANGMLYMIKNRYHGHLEYWMVDLCARIINESLLNVGTLGLLLPIFNYIFSLTGYFLLVHTLCVYNKNQFIPNRHRSCVKRLGIHFLIFTISFILMGMAYWATYPMTNSCLFWSTKLTMAEKTKDFDNKCDMDHLHAFFNYGLATLLSGFGWFARMTFDSVVDLATDNQLRGLLFPNKKRMQNELAIYALNERRYSSTKSFSVTIQQPRNSLKSIIQK